MITVTVTTPKITCLIMMSLSFVLFLFECWLYFLRNIAEHNHYLVEEEPVNSYRPAKVLNDEQTINVSIHVQ